MAECPPGVDTWNQSSGMTTESQTLTFESCMSDFVKIIGDIERLPIGSIGPDEDSRLHRQIERLFGIMQKNRWGR